MLKILLNALFVSLPWSGVPFLKSQDHKASAMGKAALLGCGFRAVRSARIYFIFTGVNSNYNSIASGFVGLNTTGDVPVCLWFRRNIKNIFPVKPTDSVSYLVYFSGSLDDCNV